MEIIFIGISIIVLWSLIGKWDQTKTIKKSLKLLQETKKPVKIPYGIIMVAKYLNKQGAGIVLEVNPSFYWNNKLISLSQEGNNWTGNTIISMPTENQNHKNEINDNEQNEPSFKEIAKSIYDNKLYKNAFESLILFSNMQPIIDKNILENEEKRKRTTAFLGGAADYITQELRMNDDEAILFITWYLTFNFYNIDSIDNEIFENVGDLYLSIANKSEYMKIQMMGEQAYKDMFKDGVDNSKTGMKLNELSKDKELYPSKKIEADYEEYKLMKKIVLKLIRNGTKVDYFNKPVLILIKKLIDKGNYDIAKIRFQKYLLKLDILKVDSSYKNNSYKASDFEETLLIIFTKDKEYKKFDWYEDVIFYCFKYVEKSI